MMRLRYLFIWLLPIVGSAQQLSVGFVGGAPAEPPISYSAKKLPFVLGPTLSVGFSSWLSLETGVLFHRLGSTEQHYATQVSGGTVITGMDEWKAGAIELPFLLRYRFLDESRTWRPFISAGPTIRRTHINFGGYRSTFSGNTVFNESIQPSETVKWNVDPAAGVGVSFRAGRVHIEPEVRYSYWGAGKHQVVRQNQAHFLFGLRF
jgi:hypothetical protein